MIKKEEKGYDKLNVPTLHVIVITEDKLVLKIKKNNDTDRNEYDNNIVIIFWIR